MRVLFITNTFPPAYTGGAEVANYHTCRGLIRRGVDCSILFVNNRMPQPVDDWYELGGIPVHRVNFVTRLRRPVTDVFDWRVYQTVFREIKRLRPDLVNVTNVSGATLAPYVACRAQHIPVVNTLHDMWLLCPNNMLLRRDGSLCDPRKGHAQCYNRYDFWGNVPRRLAVFKAFTSNVRLFLSPSQALIERHVEAGYARERFRRVPYGHEEAVLPEPSHAGVREVVGSAARHRTIVYAGGGVEIKGADVLLRAIPTVLSQVDKAWFVIAGGGETPILDQFRAFGPAVKVLGWVPFETMPTLFAVADLVVSPSIWHENSPVVIYQSYHAGVPVVGSRIGGVPELIRDGETGYLFPPGDSSALASKIIEHFSRPAYERRRMRFRCVQEVQTQLTLAQNVETTLQAYHEVLGG